MRFRPFFGVSGFFVATALSAQTALAVYLGFRAEDSSIPAVQVVCLHGIAVYAAFHLFNSAIYWRALIKGLFDVEEGNVDPLEALNKIPAAKRLMKWFNDNFAIHTGGRYSLLLVIGAEVFEFMVQSANANSMAGYLDWPALSFYATLISTNCILFGICMLSDERFVSQSVVITVDVIMDASYIMFNIFYISTPASYWPIIVPLLLSVDMLNDSMTLYASQRVQHALYKKNDRRKIDESKANGSMRFELCRHFFEILNSGKRTNRRAISVPSGYDVFTPSLHVQDSEDADVSTLLLEFTVPGATPGQIFTYNRAYTMDERGLGTEKIIRAHSKDHMTYHTVPAGDLMNTLISRRDFVGDQIWNKLMLDDGRMMILDISKSIDIPEVPHMSGFVRGESYFGLKFEETGDGGTKVTVLACIDPGGLLPTSLVNFVMEGLMKDELQNYKEYFIDRKAPDGSDNGGSWPDDESVCAYTNVVEGGLEDEESEEARNENPESAELRSLASRSGTPAARQLETPPSKLRGVRVLRMVLGWFFLLVGAGLVAYVSTKGGRQEKACEEELGACVWGRMDPKLYFKGGLLAGSTCGFGVDQNPSEDRWELDLSGCELEELGGWRDAFVDLEVLDVSNNDLAELPGWLGEGRMGKMRELQASNNKLKNFTFVNWRESVGGVNSTALKAVDLRDNDIVELGWEMMDVEGEELRLLFDGNPCAQEVDWSGLRKDRLPARMGVGYDNGGFDGSLRVLTMAHNELDASVFEELAAASFVNITDLDVSWNALGGIGEEVREQKKLRRLDVSGNSGVGARDLVAAPEDLEMLNASFCGVDDITGEQAVELQDRNMVLHGNPVTEITWAYQNQLTKIPAWLRTLEKVRKADLGYCDVKEMKGGAFPASVEELNIKNQVAGLRLLPDSFEGLSELWYLVISTNKLTEDDMHQGLFGDTKLALVDFQGNPDMLNFDAAALFPGSSGQQLEFLNLANCGLTGIGGESGTNFHGLLALKELRLFENILGDGIAADAFSGLTKLMRINLGDAGLTSLPVQVFTGLGNLLYLTLSKNDLAALPQGLFAELCSLASLNIDGVTSAAFNNDAFAGFPLCENIWSNDAKDMCEAQQHVFVEGSCSDQA
ncbi:hypothetical protein TeGR_g8519 [Tetraparma gracilis]|uniref:START domain-containing protein n=1 Tax=Tetraparma gracilis TaxID=2962635 RepID=A0ABQ6MI75_9STRA|nr:hypothetical protein TeGR_g8519 [Tetraparma gracilis]